MDSERLPRQKLAGAFFVSVSEKAQPVQVPDWVVEVLKQSPILTVCLIVVWVAIKYIREEQEKHLKSKDAEIKRLVDEKNRLQEIVLTKRLSTDDVEHERRKK